jgi:crossover junction endodeoxyribonuclease RuvC
MILGIDVGLTGAVAVLTDWGTPLECFDLPVMANGKKSARVKQQLNARALAKAIHRGEYEYLAFIEQQSARPKQGVSSMFSLGHSMGTIQGVLAALGIPFIMVQPQEWKSCFKLQHAEKDASRTVAARLFPTMELHLKKHHNRAEALLIARYGVRRNQGRLYAPDDADEIRERSDAAGTTHGVVRGVGADAGGSQPDQTP